MRGKFLFSIINTNLGYAYSFSSRRTPCWEPSSLVLIVRHNNFRGGNKRLVLKAGAKKGAPKLRRGNGRCYLKSPRNSMDIPSKVRLLRSKFFRVLLTVSSLFCTHITISLPIINYAPFRFDASKKLTLVWQVESVLHKIRIRNIECAVLLLENSRTPTADIVAPITSFLFDSE